MFLARRTLVAALVSAALVSLGGSVHAADGKVSGEVIVAGRPLAAGRIIFHQPNGQFVGSQIKDGKYVIDRVAIGEYSVTIEGKGVQPKYSDEAASALKATLFEGSNEMNFDLL